MIIKNILLAIIFLFETVILKIWLLCPKFQDSFQFSPYDAQLKNDFAILNDIGYNTILARYFHNKFIMYSTEFINRYFHFWNGNFGILFFSLVGYFGILYGIYYILIHANKSKIKYAILLVLLLIPLVLVINNPFIMSVKLLILAIPYFIFSIYGLSKFLQFHRRWGLLIVSSLLLISIWYLLIFQKDIFTNFCYNK